MKYNRKVNRKILDDFISQWKDAYIDYNFLHIFLSTISTITNDRKDLNQIKKLRLDKIESSQTNQNSSLQQLTQQEGKQIDQYLNQVQKLTVEISEIFVKAYRGECKICIQFCHQKIQEIQNRHCLSVQFKLIASNQQIQACLLPYIQYNIVEKEYLRQMCLTNIEIQRIIFRKYEKCSKNLFGLVQPQVQGQLSEILKKIQTIQNDVEKFYVSLNVDVYVSQIVKKRSKKPFRNEIKKIQKQSRLYIEQITKKNFTQHTSTFSFGFFVGLFIANIILMVVLLVQNDIKLQSNSTFNRDFPTWRGIALLTFYIWVIGIDIYYFQEYKVSHHLTFQFDQLHRTTSTNILRLAGFFSTLFSILFAIYTLNLTGFIKIQSYPPRYLVLIIWALILIFLVNPLPILYHKTRFFILKKFLHVLASPFVGSPFIVGFMTNQILTLVTPFEDLIYTGCYFTQINFDVDPPKTNICKSPARLAVFIYALIFLSYKWMQCVRNGYDKKAFFFKPQFWNTVKYSVTIITLVLSYQYRSGNKDIFGAWIAFTIISTIYSYVWDLKMDWDLLHRNVDHFLLRNKISYPRRNYYFMMIFGLALRLAWILNLSPSILQVYFGSPQLFRLITGTLEILRRGNWNILRVERQHLKNCEIFKAMPSIRDKYEEQIKRKLTQKKPQQGVQPQQSLQLNQAQQFNQNEQGQVMNDTQKIMPLQTTLTNFSKFQKSIKQLRLGQTGVEDKIREAYPALKEKTQKANQYLNRIKQKLK